MNRTRLAAALLVPLLVTACGDGDDEAADDEETSTDGGTPEEEAIRDTLVQSLLDPRCDLLTEEYLLEISFGAEDYDVACEQRGESWVEPQYDEDDIVVSDIVVTGDTATAVIGDNFSNVTTTYEFTLVDGEWKVSCDEINCDHDLEPSPEVS